MKKIPNNDIKVSIERQLTFEVTVRDKPGRKWEILRTGINNLEDAIQLAFGNSSQEKCVWYLSNSGGYSYWKSTSPNLFNSSVLEL